MDDVELAQNGGGVRGEDHLGEVVDDDFVAAVGAERGLDGRGDGAAGVDVAVDGAIFGVVAGGESLVWGLERCLEVPGKVQGYVDREGAYGLPIIALLEQVGVWGARNVERHDGGCMVV